MAAGKRVPLDQGLVARFESECGVQGSLRWIKVLVSKERIEEDATGKMSDDAEKDVVALAATISNEKEPFFALVRADGAGRWVQLAYVPDDSADQVRMLYSDNVQHVKETLGSAVVASVQLTSKGQVCWKEVTNAAGKVRSEARDAARQALHADAKERLDAFAKGAFSAVAFKIGEETPEEICACDATKVEEAGVPAEAVAKTVDPKDESRYILHRFSQEEKGAKKDRVRFVYYISSSTSAPRRKLYDAGEAAFVHYATEAGVAPEGTPLHTNDISLFTDEVLRALTSRGDVRPGLEWPKRGGEESSSDDQTDASELSFSDFTCQESGSYYPISCGPSCDHNNPAASSATRLLQTRSSSRQWPSPRLGACAGKLCGTNSAARAGAASPQNPKAVIPWRIAYPEHVRRPGGWWSRRPWWPSTSPPSLSTAATTPSKTVSTVTRPQVSMAASGPGPASWPGRTGVSMRTPSTCSPRLSTARYAAPAPTSSSSDCRCGRCRPDSPDDCAFITVAFAKWFRTYAPTALGEAAEAPGDACGAAGLGHHEVLRRGAGHG
eukprot:TRINITY_DN10715_c0_g1_i4.p1 TRINITY_DN10715_c0_g1~~TRINITY_DN10715_c0_g1_i4.p1  ORF type:complete len:597 (+),score=72.18 TRINITY_DN10715_c0_g1_i4:134-1792(+)